MRKHPFFCWIISRGHKDYRRISSARVILEQDVFIFWDDISHRDPSLRSMMTRWDGRNVRKRRREGSRAEENAKCKIGKSRTFVCALLCTVRRNKRLPAEGAVAQATEGECVQSDLDLFFVEHLNLLYTQLPPSLARLVPPPSAGRQS